MKKINDIVLFGAIALTGTFALSSCSSTDDETAEVNPTYDGETVKTQFAINIGDLGGSSTRMTEANTQSQASNVQFLGMDSLNLFAYDATTNPSSKLAWKKQITLGEFTAFDNSSSNYKLYYNVEIPTGTNNFLFYAHGKPATNKKDMEHGMLTASYTDATKPEDIYFSLYKIGGKGNTNKPDLSTVLQPIADAKLGTLAWNTLTGSNQITTAFTQFVGSASSSNTSGKAFNGSSDGILAAVKLLVSRLNGIILSGSTTTVSGSVTEVQMAQAILWAIPDSAKSDAKVDQCTAAIFSSTGDISKGTYQVTGWCSDPKYPTTLPAGSVPYRWTYADSKYTVKYIHDTKGGTTGIGTSGSTTEGQEYVSTDNICYPASLFYSCNTPVKAKDNSDITWPSTATDWQAITYNTDYWNSWEDIVTAYTTAVALRNNINYGVANLKFDVKATTDELKDNTTKIENNNTVADPLTVTLSDTKYLKLTGILIGGQKFKADWQFMPVSSSDDVAIYANIGEETGMEIKKANNATTASYCLALDNLAIGTNGSASTTQTVVNIALEFENHTGIDFMGVDGLVADGQKFYLVGKLDPKDQTLTPKSTNNTTNYNYDPEELADLRYPYASTASATEGQVTPHVFMQDFTTTANFSFSTLKNAYVNIPDLRTTKMVLGLSVNLAYNKGIQFDDVTIGGRN